MLRSLSTIAPMPKSSRPTATTATASGTRTDDQLGVGLIYVNPWMEQALLLVVFARYPDRSDLKEAVMERRQALKLFAGLALCPLCASTGFASEGHWSYEGQRDPKNGVVSTQRMRPARQAASSLPSTSPPRSAPGSRHSRSAGPNGPIQSSITATPFSLASRKATRSTSASADTRSSSSTSIIRASTLSRASGLQWKCISCTPGLTGWPSSACLWLPASRTQCSKRLSRQCHGKKAHPSRPILPSTPEGYCRPVVHITTTRDRSRHRHAVRPSTGSSYSPD